MVPLPDTGDPQRQFEVQNSALNPVIFGRPFNQNYFSVNRLRKTISIIEDEKNVLRTERNHMINLVEQMESMPGKLTRLTNTKICFLHSQLSRLFNYDKVNFRGFAHVLKEIYRAEGGMRRMRKHLGSLHSPLLLKNVFFEVSSKRSLIFQ